jgi:hypothetical protein
VHPTAAKVQERLRERGLDVEVVDLPESTRTAAEAAEACGCELGQIVKSLVFIVDERPTMILCAGDRRVTRVDGPAAAPARPACSPRNSRRLARLRRPGQRGATAADDATSAGSNTGHVRPSASFPPRRR